MTFAFEFWPLGLFHFTLNCFKTFLLPKLVKIFFEIKIPHLITTILSSA